jgi:hypothetical protein
MISFFYLSRFCTFSLPMKATLHFVRRYFYALLGLVALVLVQIGFARSYIVPVMGGTFTGRTALHIHGAVFMLWIVTCIAQPFLVERKMVQVHRKVGIYGFVLAGIVFLMGIYIAISSAHVHIAQGDMEVVKDLLIPLTDMVLFPVFVILSILSLKKPEAHKRFIVLSTLSILPAATGRMLSLFTWWTGNVIADTVLTLLVMEITLIAGIIFDAVTKKRVHPVYLWGGLAVVIVHVGREYWKKSDGWLTISDWILHHM